MGLEILGRVELPGPTFRKCGLPFSSNPISNLRDGQGAPKRSESSQSDLPAHRPPRFHFLPKQEYLRSYDQSYPFHHHNSSSPYESLVESGPRRAPVNTELVSRRCLPDCLNPRLSLPQ